MRGQESKRYAYGEARTQALLRDRLGEIGEHLVRLRRMRDRSSDALAGRMIVTLERERAKIMATVAIGAQ